MRWEFIGWLTSFKRRTKANSNKSELLFALTDKKNTHKTCRLVMMAEYAEDIRVPSVGKWEMSEGSGLLSDVRRGEERFPRVCFAPVALRLACEGGRSWKMSWLCRHPALQTHSCIHRKTNTSLCSPPRNSCEPGNQIWSGSSDLVLFFFLPLNVHAHIFLVRIQSPEKLWIMSHNTLCFVIYTHIFLKQASNSVLSLCRT